MKMADLHIRSVYIGALFNTRTGLKYMQIWVHDTPANLHMVLNLQWP